MEGNECIEWAHIVGEGTLTTLLGVCHSIITLKCVLSFQLCTMMERKQAKDITLQTCFTWVTAVGWGMTTAWWRRYKRVMSYAHEYLVFRTYCTIAVVTQLEVSLPVTKLDKLCVCVCMRVGGHSWLSVNAWSIISQWNSCWNWTFETCTGSAVVLPTCKLHEHMFNYVK